MANKLVSRPSRKKTADSKPTLKSVAPIKLSTPIPTFDVVIDYPQEEELVLVGHYAIRIGTPATHVEISINNGPWNECRSTAGYFWFDWTVSDLGETVIKTRARLEGGKWKVSRERFCRVVNSKKA